MSDSTPAPVTDVDVDALAGPVAARELAAAKPIYHQQLVDWLVQTAALDDRAFVSAAVSAIHGSALANSFRGNWEHEHFKASAVYHLSRARHVAAGHTPECRGATLYDRAYQRVAIEAGHAALAVSRPVCTCQPG